MTRYLLALAAWAVLAPIPLSAANLGGPMGPDFPLHDARAFISVWPPAERRAAEALLAKYGPPSIVTRAFLVWSGEDPWIRTIAYGGGVGHGFPIPHQDSVQQVIQMRVPPERVGDLLRFNGSILVDRTSGEVSARCDSEATNFLTLNLAREILDGKRTVEDARRFHAETLAATMAGRQSEYTRRLRFRARENGGDSDKALLSPGFTPGTQPGKKGSEPRDFGPPPGF